MKTLILHHDDCIRHEPGRRHPERPARITAVLNGIKNITGTESLPAPPASPSTRFLPVKQRMHFAPSDRPATTPASQAPWASAC